MSLLTGVTVELPVSNELPLGHGTFVVLQYPMARSLARYRRKETGKDTFPNGYIAVKISSFFPAIADISQSCQPRARKPRR